MMKTVNVMRRNYKRMLPYEKGELGGKFGSNDERRGKAERDFQYLLGDEITTTVNDMKCHKLLMPVR